MNPILLVMSAQADPPTAGGAYTWANGKGGSKTVSWTNPNASPLTLTLAAWPAGTVSWVTSSPVVIAAKASANITATKGTTSGTPVSDAVDLPWACEGTKGTVEAEAEYYKT